MYERPDDYRCIECGWTFELKTGIINERPTKPHDSVCGEVLYNLPNGDKSLPRIIKGMCSDDSNCQFNPKTMKQTERGDWISVCAIHA